MKSAASNLLNCKILKQKVIEEIRDQKWLIWVYLGKNFKKVFSYLT